MPTKKKRVGFIPREDVMKIIDKLSIENNLSNSKIISILVEEALSIRGIFNKKNGKVSQSYNLNNNKSQNWAKSLTFHYVLFIKSMQYNDILCKSLTVLAIPVNEYPILLSATRFREAAATVGDLLLPPAMGLTNL